MKKLLLSIVAAMNGIRIAIVEERNMKIHLGIATGVVIAGIYLGITSVEWCIILLTIALVVGLEMMNSAIENVVDLVTLEHHPIAGKAKDVAAGAVLAASIVAVVVGVVVFWKYVFE